MKAFGFNHSSSKQLHDDLCRLAIEAHNFPELWPTGHHHEFSDLEFVASI